MKKGGLRRLLAPTLVTRLFAILIRVENKPVVLRHFGCHRDALALAVPDDGQLHRALFFVVYRLDQIDLGPDGLSA